MHFKVHFSVCPDHRPIIQPNQKIRVELDAQIWAAKQNGNGDKKCKRRNSQKLEFYIFMINKWILGKLKP